MTVQAGERRSKFRAQETPGALFCQRLPDHPSLPGGHGVPHDPCDAAAAGDTDLRLPAGPGHQVVVQYSGAVCHRLALPHQRLARPPQWQVRSCIICASQHLVICHERGVPDVISHPFLQQCKRYKQAAPLLRPRPPIYSDEAFTALEPCRACGDLAGR